MQLALENGQHVEAVEALLKADLEAERPEDDDDNLPLHLAAKHDNELEVVEALLEANPDLLHKASSDGNLPLHMAVGSAKRTLYAILARASRGEPTRAGRSEEERRWFVGGACRFVLCLECEMVLGG